MKKLKLNLESIKEVLSKETMKKVVGGYDYGSGTTYACTCSGSSTVIWVNASNCHEAQSTLMSVCYGASCGC